MRVRTGDEITLFDGHGYESRAVIESIDKRNCTVVAEPAVAVDREPPRKLHLGIALPKPDRAKELVERLTELGVMRVTPLVCQRTQRPPSDSLLEKLRRIVVESCKQCGRNRLMDIAAPLELDEFLGRDEGGHRLIADPGGSRLRGIAVDEHGNVSALVGPEGGFTEDEVARATRAGAEKVGLGKRIYRIETAATVLAAHFADA
jgi:16S rRNA (uracil1498-N3)-methyltransferase